MPGASSSLLAEDIICGCECLPYRRYNTCAILPSCPGVDETSTTTSTPSRHALYRYFSAAIRHATVHPALTDSRLRIHAILFCVPRREQPISSPKVMSTTLMFSPPDPLPPLPSLRRAGGAVKQRSAGPAAARSCQGARSPSPSLPPSPRRLPRPWRLRHPSGSSIVCAISLLDKEASSLGMCRR